MRRLIPIVLLLAACTDQKSRTVVADLRPYVESPTRIEAFRSTPSSDPMIHWTSWKTTAPVLATPPIAARLATALLDDRGYVWGEERPGLIVPTFRLDFYQGEKRMQIWLDFNCSYLYATCPERSFAATNFEPIRRQLQNIAKELFPRDPEIQAMTFP